MLSDSQNGWVKMYHPSGAQVTLPIPAMQTEEEGINYAFAFRCVSAAIEAGFTVDAPGLEAGEQIEEVGYVVKGELEQRGETTQFLLLYSTNDQLQFSFLKKYLDKDTDIADFQKASGMRLQDIPLYSGQDKPQRGKSKTTDKYIVKVPRPFKVILKKNPQFDEEKRQAAVAKGEVYNKSARVFVRWEGQQSAAQPADGGKQTPEFDPAEELKKWETFLLSDPPLQVVTDWVKDAATIKGKLAAVKLAVEEWKARSGAWWDAEAGRFMPPKEQDPDTGFVHPPDDPIPF